MANQLQVRRGVPDSGSPVKESTALLTASRDNVGDFRGFLNTDEEDRQAIAKKTCFGEVRNIKRLGWVEWAYLVIATFTMLGLLGISIERFISIQQAFHNFTPGDDGNGSGSVFGSIETDSGYGDGWIAMDGGPDNTTSDCNEWTCLNDFIYGLLLLLNLLCCAFYCYDGIMRERPFEMISYASGMSVIMIYVIVNYSLEGEQGDVVKLVRLVLVIIICPQSIVLAFVVQYRMGYLVLNTIGSNQALTRAYNSRSVLITSQSFNVQVLANILVLSWAKNGHFTSLGEKIALPMVLVFMFVVAYIGWIAVVWEHVTVAIVWFFLTMPNVGLYVYKIVNVAVHWKAYEKAYTEYYVNGNPPGVTHFTINAIVTFVLCVLGLICCVAMVVLMIMSVRSFGKGLKEKLPPPCFYGSGHRAGTVL